MCSCNYISYPLSLNLRVDRQVVYFVSLEYHVSKPSGKHCRNISSITSHLWDETRMRHWLEMQLVKLSGGMTTRVESGKRNAIINFLSTNFTPFCQNAKCQKLLVMFSTFMPITHSSSKVWTNLNFDVYFIFSDGQSFLDRPKSR